MNLCVEMKMKVINVLIIVLMILSSIVNIQGINSTNITGNSSSSNLNLNPVNSVIQDPVAETSPINDWKSSEDKYWQEQMKNYQLTKTFGNASEGIDLSTPNIARKLSSSSD